jgi:hypothetical protein
MMEQPDPTYDITYDPTFDRDRNAERIERGAGDRPGRAEVRPGRGSEPIRPAEERGEDPGGPTGDTGENDLGWRGARDREYFG